VRLEHSDDHFAGWSMIAEIHRLSHYIPDDFTFRKVDKPTHPAAHIIWDSDYFENDRVIEDGIDATWF
jgi:hypothetical protein